MLSVLSFSFKQQRETTLDNKKIRKLSMLSFSLGQQRGTTLDNNKIK